MAQEMQRLSDQSNAATMQTAQLKSRQALVGRLSELDYPAKAATAGLNEARANEEQSERSLRRGSTSSIEFERTYEVATDPSQYVLKESRKVTVKLPVADVERPTRTRRFIPLGTSDIDSTEFSSPSLNPSADFTSDREEEEKEEEEKEEEEEYLRQAFGMYSGSRLSDVD
jgi:hypothetical protein